MERAGDTVTALPSPGRILFVAPNPSIDRYAEVDVLTVGAINRPELLLAVPGGKGLNAARAAALLGGRATAVALLGGRAGDWIADQLAAAGIDVRLVHDEGMETRSCLSVLDRSTGRFTEFYEPGQPIGETAWTEFEAVIHREVAGPDLAIVVCSGSLPPGAPVAGYARIVQAVEEGNVADGRRVLTILDSHGPPLALALAQRPSIVKVNGAEAAEATNQTVTGPDDAVRAARALIAQGAGQVVVTLGADGAIACDGRSAVRLASHENRGAYPVGSGDSFVAGLAIALAAGSTLGEAARHGMAAGIANALRPGPGILDPVVAGRLLAGVTLATMD